MSAKLKIIITIALLIFISIVIVSTISYIKFSSASTAEYTNKLSNSTFLITKSLEEKINRYFDSLIVISESIQIDKNSKAIISDELIELMNNSKQRLNILNVYFGLEDGTTYSASNKGIIPNFNAKDKKREWYLKGFSGDDKIVTTPYLSTTGDLTISVVIPVKRKTHIIGVLGLSVKMSLITDFVHTLSKNLNIHVSRSDGFIMASDTQDQIGKNIYHLIPSFKQYAEQSFSDHNYNFDNEEYFVVSSRSNSLNWNVWASATIEEINLASNQVLLMNTIVGVILCSLSLIFSYILVIKLVYNPIGGEPLTIKNIVTRIAEGDLTSRSIKNDNATGIYSATIVMHNNLKNIIREITSSAKHLTQSATNISGSSEVVNNSSESQMIQLEKTTAAMNEMSITVSNVAQNAVQASASVNEANTNAKQGLDLINEMNTEMVSMAAGIENANKSILDVEQESTNVGNILVVIKGIAEQINLLALNASIEAARAGESGRGFAVVADEVRNLAQKTQNSTNEIQSMILNLQTQAKISVQLMKVSVDETKSTANKSHEVKSVFASIDEAIAVIGDMNNQIATTASQQSRVTEDVNENVKLVNELAKVTFHNSHENTKSCQALSNVSSKLMESVEKFRI